MVLCYGNLSKRGERPKTARRTNRILQMAEAWWQWEIDSVGWSLLQRSSSHLSLSSWLWEMLTTQLRVTQDLRLPQRVCALTVHRAGQWRERWGRKSVRRVLLLLQGKEGSAPECRWYASAGKTNKQNKQNMLFHKWRENIPKWCCLMEELYLKHEKKTEAWDGTSSLKQLGCPTGVRLAPPWLAGWLAEGMNEWTDKQRKGLHKLRSHPVSNTDSVTDSYVKRIRLVLFP